MEVTYPEKGILQSWTSEEGGHPKRVEQNKDASFDLITLYLLTNYIYRGWGWAKRALFARPQLEDAYFVSKYSVINSKRTSLFCSTLFGCPPSSDVHGWRMPFSG